MRDETCESASPASESNAELVKLGFLSAYLRALGLGCFMARSGFFWRLAALTLCVYLLLSLIYVVPTGSCLFIYMIKYSYSSSCFISLVI